MVAEDGHSLDGNCDDSQLRQPDHGPWDLPTTHLRTVLAGSLRVGAVPAAFCCGERVRGLHGLRARYEPERIFRDILAVSIPQRPLCRPTNAGAWYGEPRDATYGRVLANRHDGVSGSDDLDPAVSIRHGCYWSHSPSIFPSLSKDQDDASLDCTAPGWHDILCCQ